MFIESTKQYWVGFPSEAIINENEKDKTYQTSNDSFYDHDTEGSVRFLDQEWVKQKCEKEYFVQLKQKPNKTHPIPGYMKNSILGEMQRLCSLHCAHVYKCICKMTLKQKFYNTLPVKKKKRFNHFIQIHERISQYRKVVI